MASFSQQKQRKIGKAASEKRDGGANICGERKRICRDISVKAIIRAGEGRLSGSRKRRCGAQLAMNNIGKLNGGEE